MYCVKFQSKMKLSQGKAPRCMEHDISTRRVYVTKCKPKSEDQKWIVENYNSTASNWSFLL